MNAADELRAMVDRICTHLGEAGINPATTRDQQARLLLDAAALMSGVAAGLDDARGSFELTRDGEAAR